MIVPRDEDRPKPDGPHCKCRIVWNPNGNAEYRRFGNADCIVSHAGPSGRTMTAS